VTPGWLAEDRNVKDNPPNKKMVLRDELKTIGFCYFGFLLPAFFTPLDIETPEDAAEGSVPFKRWTRFFYS
jgi:hypothetical protein